MRNKLGFELLGIHPICELLTLGTVQVLHQQVFLNFRPSQALYAIFLRRSIERKNSYKQILATSGLSVRGLGFTLIQVMSYTFSYLNEA